MEKQKEVLLNWAKKLYDILPERTQNFIKSKAIEKSYNVFNSLPDDQKKRALEIVMRTHDEPTPQTRARYIIDTVKENPVATLKSAKHYIETGEGNNYLGDHKYGGLWKENPEVRFFDPRRTSLGPTGEGDIVDAYLYNTPLNPKIAVPVEAPEGDYGFHTEYMKKNYPNTKSQYVKVQPKHIQQVNQEGITPFDTIPAIFNFPTSEKNINVDNHGTLVELGTRNDSVFIKGHDVYDFKADDYIKSQNVRDSIGQKAVKIMDKIGHPIVMETPWIYWEDIPKIDFMDLRKGDESPWSARVTTLFLKKYPEYRKDINKYYKTGKLDEDLKDKLETFFDENQALTWYKSGGLIKKKFQI